ncbi:rod shape-determining protein RodA [Candidatus Uhrbacteria bacterium]|nr:rod shape-determining protein RodA [Candidatus Uhrbacteria bacterium]
MPSLFRLARIRVTKLRGADWYIVLAAFVLILFGLAAIYSIDLSRETELFHFKKQLFAIVIAGIFSFFLATSNYKLLRNYSLVLYLFGIVLLLAVLIFGTTVRGARGWFVFDLFSFQPVEYMKLVLILSLASYFSQRARPQFGLRECLESAGITILPIILTLLQPDLGSAFILAGLWFCFALFAGMRFRFILALCGIFSGVFFLAWRFLFVAYQKARILTFFDPTFDPLGQGYNVSQAMIAIGAGGLFGRGLGFGSQSQLKFLPESQTDFIFAVIAEELGFLGVVLVLGACVLLFSRFAFLIKTSRDNFSSFLVVGVACTFFLQILVNIGMNLGLFPVTGIGLPLVSYGGSSVALFLVLLGIIQSVVIHEKRS